MVSPVAWLAVILLSVIALWYIVGYIGLLMWQRDGLVSRADRRPHELDEVTPKPLEKPRRRHKFA
jgi:hypothetical protein